MSARHILFDLDGTLIDSAPSILSGFARVLGQNGIKPMCELTQALIGPPLNETLRRISGIENHDLIEKLAKDFKHYYDEIGYKETQEYLGVSTMLRNLEGCGFHLFLVTNKRMLPTRKIVDLMSWSGHFRGIYSPDYLASAVRAKSVLIRNVLVDYAIPYSSAVYVGDRDEDYKAAAVNEVSFVGVKWGYGSWPTQKSKSYVLMRNVKELEKHMGFRS